MRGIAQHRLVSVVAVVAMILLATAPLIGATGDAQPALSGPGAVRPALSASSPEGMYAYYYLWWDTHHWQTTLGPNYPFGQSPLPAARLPGCHRVQSHQSLQRQHRDRCSRCPVLRR